MIRAEESVAAANNTTTSTIALETVMDETQKPHVQGESKDLTETTAENDFSQASFVVDDLADIMTLSWPECSPLYMEKRLVANWIGDLPHQMIFHKQNGGRTNKHYAA